MAARRVALVTGAGTGVGRAAAIALAAMGLILLDIPALEPLVELCNQTDRSDFLVTMAPLRIKGGTGSPVNPIAIF